MVKISVIVPVYNAEAYICRCVDSILGQSFSDFELILIDDGSPDNCGVICDDYAKKDSRIRVIHQENGGLSAARNAGIDWAFKNSDSQWLTFIDSDDWIHPDYLSHLYFSAMEAKLPLSVCGFIRTTGDEPVIQPAQLVPETWSPEVFFVDHNVNAIIACGKLYKKALFENIRYPVGKLHEDEFTTYKLLFATKKIAVIFAPLYYYFQGNENSIMRSSYSPRRIDYLYAIEEKLEFFKSQGYHSAYLHHTYSYLIQTTIHIKLLQTHCRSSEISRYMPILRKMLRRAIRIRRRNKQLPFNRYSWVYELAYPRFMWLYWTLRGAIGKVLQRKSK